jgi:hypothetical protein
MKTASARQVAGTLVPALLILAIMVYVHLHSHIPFASMTRDVTAIGHLNPFTGMLSDLGIILWCVSASACFFAALILFRGPDRKLFWFLLFSGLLSAYLLFDDFFQFHEELAERYLGLNKTFVYAALGTAVAAYLVGFRQVILRTRFGLLALACGFLAASVAIDVVAYVLEVRLGNWWWLGRWWYFFEDGPKWLGIAFWCSYYVQTAHQCLTDTMGHLGREAARAHQQP